MPKSLGSEIARRRTFAIISHPDAGKTTMTEKLLLYGGAIHLAGTVKSRKASRHATSDWMEIEKQRGISVTSSVMQFDYNGFCINILDTPGHQDFSEDTYRTLCAADAAVMLIDGAKGVEAQTIKLFTVCRQRQIPIFTFINKMDRAAKNPFDLMDELEKVLGINSIPINWPIGTDGDFQGVYNRKLNRIERFDASKGDHGASMVKVKVTSLDDPGLASIIGSSYQERLMSDIEMLDIAGDDLDMARILAGELTPVFFGSALSNFGVEAFLNEFLAMAPPPVARKSNEGPIKPDEDFFSGFVFKIQANMNPGHRDRMAFIRICSGRFEKGLEVNHARLGKTVRLTQPQQFMAQERNIIEEAYAGDIIGIFDPGLFQISDTLSTGSRTLAFEDIPVFPPEHFARVSPADSMKRKQFLRGVEQLAEEGAIQLYKEPDIGTETYIVGVVGVLQLEVLEYRLKAEYGVSIRQQLLNYRHARWIQPERGVWPELKELNLTSTTQVALDKDDLPVLLFESEWAIQWAIDRNKGLHLASIHERK
ncbi:MAG: peptide chain release factor 3 [Clostridiaceae bacterium]|nr:peptide chain release factor 3 [Clostridiaceae bacterium]